MTTQSLSTLSSQSSYALVTLIKSTWLLMTCKHDKYRSLTSAYEDQRFGRAMMAEQHVCLDCGKTRRIS